MQRTLGLLATLMAIVLTLASCSSPREGAPEGGTGEGAVTVRDSHGEVSLDAPPERIVVMDLGALDTLDALGVGDRVVGIPKGSTIPEHLQKFAGDDVTNVGSLLEPDLEAINSAKPDLVILGARQSDFYADIAKVFPTLDVSYDMSLSPLEATEQQAEMLGTVTGTSELAGEKIQQMNDAAAQAEGSLEGRTGLILMTTGGKITLHGPESRFGLVHSVFGAEPAVADIESSPHGQPASFEVVADANPDMIFVVDRDSVVSGGGQNAEATLDNDLVNGTTAAQENGIVYLDAARWYIVGTGLNNVPAMIDEVTSAA